MIYQLNSSCHLAQGVGEALEEANVASGQVGDAEQGQATHGRG